MHANLQLLPPARSDAPRAQTLPPDPDDPDGNELARLLRTLWRWRALILLVTLFGTLAVAAAVLRLPASYRAEAVLLFTPATATGDPAGTAAAGGQSGDLRYLASEIERIRSRSLLTRVVRQAGLIYEPAFNPMLARTPGPLERLGLQAPPSAAALKLSRQRAATLAVLRDRLRVRPVGQSRALSLSVDAPTAAGAARVANTVAQVYLEQARERARAERAAATAWLDRRVAELRERVQAADAAVADFRIGSGLAERGPESAGTQQRVGELNRALAQARVEAAAARGRLQQVNARAGGGSAAGDPPPGDAGRSTPGAPVGAGAVSGAVSGDGGARLLTSPLLQGLRREAAELERERAQLATRYGPRHPRLREANVQLLDLRTLIDDEIGRHAAGLARDAELARDHADALEAELRDVNNRTGALGRAQVKLAQLAREAAAERALFDSFLARLKATRVNADPPGTRAELITRAQPPAQPAAPNRPLLAGFGALAVATIAVALALLLQLLDRGVRAAEQLERLTGLRTLGTVPRVRQAPASRVLARPAGALAEALRGLYTALLLGDLDRPPRTLLVTSALPGEGKTGLVSALGRVLARSGRRVLLVDADLRYPHLARTLKLPAAPGLSELLTRQCDLAAALYTDPAPELEGRLDLLPAGRASDPGRLLESDRLGRLIAELAPRYDIVLVDAPPVLAVADPRTLALRVDATVLAVRWARTPRASVQRAVALLRDAGAELAGAALVQVDARHHAREASGYDTGLGRRRQYYAGT